MTKLPVNLCTICRKPGACCKGFQLSISFWDNQDVNEQWQQALERQAGSGNGPLSQFHPIQKNTATTVVDKESNESYSYWSFSCDALLPNGLCGMYEMRPFPCRDYRPGTDKLCVMFVENKGVANVEEEKSKDTNR